MVCAISPLHTNNTVSSYDTVQKKSEQARAAASVSNGTYPYDKCATVSLKYPQVQRGEHDVASVMPVGAKTVESV